MAFVAKQAAEIINRPELTLSATEQIELSHLTNELSELIYATSVPLQSVKGYLSIFRNMTDSQPLADNVLERLNTAPTLTENNS